MDAFAASAILVPSFSGSATIFYGNAKQGESIVNACFRCPTLFRKKDLVWVDMVLDAGMVCGRAPQSNPVWCYPSTSCAECGDGTVR